MLSAFISNHSSLQGALPILFDAALKGAILVIIATCAAYLLRNRSAASRHAVWTAAVIGHLAIPALVLILPAWSMPVLPAASWMQAASAPATQSGPTGPETKSTGVTPSKSASAPTSESRSAHCRDLVCRRPLRASPSRYWYLARGAARPRWRSR